MRETATAILCLMFIAVPTLAQDLCEVAAEGDVEQARSLLDAGADLRSRDGNGNTPLHAAARRGHPELLDLLLDRGAEIDARNHSDETALLVATMALQYEACERLAARGADLEIPNDYGRTPLIWTAREGGDLRMARLLLRLGADVDATDRFGASALELAAWRNFGTLVGILLDAGARFDVNPGMEHRLLYMAASEGLERLWSAVIAGGGAVDLAEQRMPLSLHLAASGGSGRIVQDLLDHGARPDSIDVCGWTPLHHAADRGRVEVARALAEADAVKDRRTLSGWTPLGLARHNGNPATVQVLEEAGHRESGREFPRLTGPWLGQGEAPAAPEPFALDIVSTVWGLHGGVSFTPDGREAFWSGYADLPDSGYTVGTIFTSRLRDGRWTPPAPAPFVDEENRGDVPFVAPDGQRLFFLSRRPLPGGQTTGKENIWLVEREGDGWGGPRPLPSCVNDMPQHWQVSVAANGNLYFASDRSAPGTRGVYVSRPEDGIYTEPEFLGFAGGSPFIAPDESYLLTETNHGRDNALRVRRDDGSWSDPVSITEFWPRLVGPCPRVSPDGRAYFVLGDADLWVAAGFLEDWKRLAGLNNAAYAMLRAGREGSAAAVADVAAAVGADTDAWYVSERTLNLFGYRLLGDDAVDAAVAVFEFIVETFPESANAYDSLGEGCMRAGRDEEAAAHYRKSLELDPGNANAEAMLERLAAGGG